MGGVACALAAARNGLKVILTEEYDWIGGQLTSQAVPPDEHPWIEERGSTKTYRAFRQKVRDFYVRNYPLTDAAKKNPLLNPGNGSVSKLCHEPRVALAVLLEMLAPHITAGRVTLLQPYAPVFVDTDGDRLTVVDVQECRAALRNRIALHAPYFVDATETGDLLLLGESRVRHRRGIPPRHSRAACSDTKPTPTTTRPFTFCFAMDYEEGKDHRIEEPAGVPELARLRARS